MVAQSPPKRFVWVQVLVSLPMKQNKMIGLIGGNSSFASAYFYKLLSDKAVRDYGAKNNNDFPHISIDSLPVPDFISDEENLGQAMKMLQGSLLNLEKQRATSIAIVCNTIHILSDLKSPHFVSLIEIACKEVIERGYKRVGILATPTTIKHDLYGKFLRKNGVEVVYSDTKLQKYHEEIIRKVIAGKTEDNNLENLTKEFIEQNDLDGVVLGCTELPLVFPKNRFNNVVDCLNVLANELLFRYYHGR